jgi:hypothetical protein
VETELGLVEAIAGEALDCGRYGRGEKNRETLQLYRGTLDSSVKAAWME